MMPYLNLFQLERFLFAGILLPIFIWPTVARGQTLQNGEEVLSSISVGGIASFDFNVNGADEVIVSVGETGTGLPAQPQLQILDPNGNQVGIDGSTSTSSSDAYVQFSTLQAGMYTAVVSEVGNNQALEFRIRAIAIASASPVLINNRDFATSNGQEVESDFPLGTFAVFPFQVDAAGEVIVSVGETGNGLPAEPQLQVFDPDGNRVGIDGSTSTSSSDAYVQFTTLQTGTYTAVVNDVGNNISMEFRIRALALPGIPLLIGDRDVGIANTQEALSSFSLGTFAVFLFQVDAAGLITVSVGETGIDLLAEPQIQIFDPDGDLVAMDGSTSTSSSNAFVQFNTFQTGIYAAVVRDVGNNDAMEFSIVANGISDDIPGQLGDVNGDGSVDFLDISPFISILSTADYQAEADINGDGLVNFSDISPFIDLLSS